MDLIKLRYEIENIYNLPTLPSMLRKLLILIEDPTVSMGDLGRFIMQDPALCSRIIKTANSPIYGLPQKVKTISQALMLLGMNSIKGLLLGVSVFDLMQKTMAGLWQHSAACAIAAKIIAEHTGHKDIAEDVAVTALLHDIGKVIFCLKFSKEYDQLLQTAKNKHKALVDEETKRFHANHSDVGSWLAYKWNFPKSLVESIKYHHNSKMSKEATVNTAIVDLANILVKALGVGFSGDDVIPPLHQNVIDTLSLDEQKLKTILSEIDTELPEIEELLA